MDEGYIKFNCNWIPLNDVPLNTVEFGLSLSGFNINSLRCNLRIKS